MKEDKNLAPQSHSRIDFLDYLRIFAFLSVVMGHKFIEFLADNENYHITVRAFFQIIYHLCFGGAAGVVVFFLISGYIIAHVLQRETSLEFIIKRIFRIYPLYIVAIFCEIFALMAFEGKAFPPFQELLIRLLLIGDFFSLPPALLGVEWTLRVEIVFYVFMAIAKSLKLFDKYFNIFASILFALPLLIYLNFLFGSVNWAKGYFGIFSPILLAGVIFYFNELKKINNTEACFSVFVILAICLTSFASFAQAHKDSHGIFLGLLLFTIAWKYKDKIKGNAVIKYFSSLTYSIYLFHNWSWPYITHFVSKLDLPLIFIKLIVMVVLIFICHIFTSTIEKWGIRQGKNICARVVKKDESISKPAT